MGYGKNKKLMKIVVIIVAVIFIASFIFGVATPLLSGRYNTAIYEDQSGDTNIQPDSIAPIEQPGAASDAAQYITNSSADSIDILVNYLSPATGDTDFLKFEVIMGTHSVDLSAYEDLSKYLELRTSDGAVINSGFVWNLESGDGHHISGSLEIENKAAGKPIVGPTTKSFSLVFKNIGNTAEREHLYELDKLK